MGEEAFFDALYNIMWDMEVDIFSEEEKTVALLADLVPKCKKQRRRLKAMYVCGAMGFIEQAIANSEYKDLYLKKAVRQLISNYSVSIEKALFAVNSVVSLWEGSVSKLRDYDEYEDLDILSEEESFDEADDYDEDMEDEEDFGGDEEMMMLQDVAVEEEAQEEEIQEEEENYSDEPKESVFKNLLISWCEGDCEEGRPYIFACPIGWVLIILCSLLGAFMIYDITTGDKFVVPTFAFMFTVLTTKRLYRFESTGRFSIYVAALYVIAMLRSIWLAEAQLSYLCIPVVLVALIVFNNGRIATWLDQSKKSSVTAYSLITLFSAIITVGAYAIQQVVL